MHGGREELFVGEIKKRMLSVPLTRLSSIGDSNCFVKDGRKINVGDCALFKPLQDSPPFIGIIHCSTSGKGNNLILSVNWLYRPAEVELGEGVAPEAAPNEVFYSFHSDEISAASLLHPCKVAFLPKGVELPPGVSSFVCRRVYDITNKRLWWLTDRDYIDDHQKEVDQLLYRTRREMHMTTQQQQGTRSPKPVNGSATSPLKHSPDSMQNSSSNFSSQTKGKKRERGDQSSEPIKRERSSRADDGDSGQLRSESMLKLEIAKFTEKGGLVDSEQVERLVQLMQLEKSERRTDLTGRSMLAGIIAATDKVEFLNQFVQLKGLPVLDEWLQEVHKGKIRDPGNHKDDKSVEDFLFVLLRALDKLPVNLNALQMCNIGKSVNHLRSHKNTEIQKKARSLVDTWKKRVEAEMNINDAKSASGHAVAWPGRSRHDGSHGGNRHSSGSSEAAIRSSVTHHSSLKPGSVKHVHGESTSKSASPNPGAARSALSPASTSANYKDPAQAVVKEEKSSSSSQSRTDSQCSSDHVKTIVASGKEDARSSTAGSKSFNKLTGSGSKHRKSANGLQGAANSGVQRETLPNTGTSVARVPVAEKVSHGVNAIDPSVTEGNSHKLIVKIPNRGRGVAQTIAGSVEDSSSRNSRGSSPAPSEKHEQSDASLREKHDPQQSSEVDALSTAIHNRVTNDSRRAQNVSKVDYSPSRNEIKPRKALDSAFSSMNALVESCVKFSEATASMAAGDDVGMNLLASVAAGEMSQSGAPSPAVSPLRDSTAAENSCSNENANKKQMLGVSKDDDGETIKRSGSSSEIQQQNEEGSLMSNGKLDEHVGVASLPMSSACATGRSGGDGSIAVRSGKNTFVKEEILNRLPVASEDLCGPLASEDKVKDTTLGEESEKRAHRDKVLCPSSNVDDKKDTGLLKSESANADEKTAMVSSAVDQDLAGKTSNEVTCEKIDGSQLSECAGIDEKKRSDEANDPSSVPQKQEQPGSSTSDTEHNSSCKDENLENKETLAHQPGSSTKQETAAVSPQETETHLTMKGAGLTAANGEKKEENASATGNAAVSPGAGGSDSNTKLGFDLNEGFSVDEGKGGDEPGPCPIAVCSTSPLPNPVSSSSVGVPSSITVAAAAKGPFVPLDDLLRNKQELRWKGSAATSAFRPAEPRKVVEAPVAKPARPLLDFDLNVADESEESTSSLRCSGGFDLDLNKVDESPDVGQQHFAINGPRLEPLKASSSSIFSNGDASGRRVDFDLNNGPAAEETPFEQIPYNHHITRSNNIPLQPPPFGPRINSSETGNCFAWYPPGASYSVSMMTPSALPDREAVFPIVGMGSSGHHQRLMGGGPTPTLSFNPTSVLSSTPAIPFHSTPFQYPVFPFGTSFPLPTSAPGGSSGFPAIPSQLVGTAAAVPFQYPHGYVVSRPVLPDNGVVDNSSQKWGKQGGLDLNSGPNGVDAEGRDESLATVSRQMMMPAISSQSLTEEQARMFNISGGVLKRKEPEGGWTNMDKLNFKQSSWR